MSLSTPETRSIFEILNSGEINSKESVKAFIDAFQGTFERMEISERRYRELYDNAPDMYHTLDLEGNFIEFNPKHIEILGFSQEELEGAHLSKIFPESALQRLAEVYQKLLQQGFLANCELEIQKKDGSIFSIDVHAMVYDRPNSGGQEVRCIMRDITERKRLDEQLRQSQKMESVALLAGGVAHDFNNLLSAILSYAELAIMQAPEEGSLRSYLAEILRAGQRASHLTRQLLSFSRHQSGEPETLNLNELIFDIEKLLRRLIRENVELVLPPSTDLWPIKSDPGQMEQVVINLVINARDAITEGGKITIQTSNVTLDKPLAGFHSEAAPGDYVLLSIGDNGCGISDEVKCHIFEPFFTTKEADRGTGLGLSTCNGIIVDNGGVITVNSGIGLGTVFNVYLPRSNDYAADHSTDELGTQELEGGETVLLVEDEMSLRVVMAQVLRDHGYHVLEASNGVEAINAAHLDDTGQIDLLLTDVVMPLMGGRELVQQLKTFCPQTKIIYTSGYPGESIGNLDLEELNAEFIRKPITPAVLTQKVREVLDR